MTGIYLYIYFYIIVLWYLLRKDLVVICTRSAMFCLSRIATIIGNGFDLKSSSFWTVAPSCVEMKARHHSETTHIHKYHHVYQSIE